MPTELTEQERIAQYQRGWNAAKSDDVNSARARLESQYYYIGFVEARAGTPNRFANYEGA